MEKKNKLSRCIEVTRECIEKANVKTEKGETLMKFARDYYEDSLYYRERDPETSLEAVSYAHGFLDAGVLLGHIEIPNYQLEKVK